MERVSVRELRNNGGEVLNRVARGERLQVTRDGEAVAELVPLPRPRVTGTELLRRSRRLPPVDLAEFRRDVDAVVDQRW